MHITHRLLLNIDRKAHALDIYTDSGDSPNLPDRFKVVRSDGVHWRNLAQIYEQNILQLVTLNVP